MEFEQWVGTHSCVRPSLTYKETGSAVAKTPYFGVMPTQNFYWGSVRVSPIFDSNSNSFDPLMKTLPFDVTYFPRHGSLHIQFLRKQRLDLAFTQVEFNVYSAQVS